MYIRVCVCVCIYSPSFQAEREDEKGNPERGRAEAPRIPSPELLLKMLMV